MSRVRNKVVKPSHVKNGKARISRVIREQSGKPPVSRRHVKKGVLRKSYTATLTKPNDAAPRESVPAWDEENVLDWDAVIEGVSRYPSGTIEVTLEYGGCTEFEPFDDPWAEE